MPSASYPTFPPEAVQMRNRLCAEQHLTSGQRILAAVEALRAAEAMSQSGQVRAAQLAHQRHLEEEWRRRIREFIDQHVQPSTDRP